MVSAGFVWGMSICALIKRKCKIFPQETSTDFVLFHWPRDHKSRWWSHNCFYRQRKYKNVSRVVARNKLRSPSESHMSPVNCFPFEKSDYIHMLAIFVGKQKGLRHGGDEDVIKEKVCFLASYELPNKYFSWWSWPVGTTKPLTLSSSLRSLLRFCCLMCCCALRLEKDDCIWMSAFILLDFG